MGPRLVMFNHRVEGSHLGGCMPRLRTGLAPSVSWTAWASSSPCTWPGPLERLQCAGLPGGAGGEQEEGNVRAHPHMLLITQNHHSETDQWSRWRNVKLTAHGKFHLKRLLVIKIIISYSCRRTDHVVESDSSYSQALRSGPHCGV